MIPQLGGKSSLPASKGKVEISRKCPKCGSIITSNILDQCPICNTLLEPIPESLKPAQGGKAGFLFAFVVRQRVTREDGDECLFDFVPVFVSADCEVDVTAVASAVSGTAVESQQPTPPPPDPTEPFQAARLSLEEKHKIWDWNDDVEFLGLSWVVFLKQPL